MVFLTTIRWRKRSANNGHADIRLQSSSELRRTGPPLFFSETGTMILKCLAGALVGLAFLASSALSQQHEPVTGKRGMVVSAQRLASEAGVEILKAGGNAIDAAVAVGYAEAVVNPCCGNIGGGGFMVIHLSSGKDTVINFREAAPRAASQDMYLDAAGNVVPGASFYGYKSAGVPGTVLGLDEALRKYGRLSRKRVMAPAIRLARDGFVLTKGDTDILDPQADMLRKDPEAARIFLRPDGSRLQPGDRLVQRDLARTLSAIAQKGPSAFYNGAIPRSVAKASARHGGILTEKDFAEYRAAEVEPLRCFYRSLVIVSVAPPSSGGVTMCEILNILEGYDLKAAGFHTAESVRLFAEAARHAYHDRNNSLGDPVFVANPLERLLSKDYAAALRQKIARGESPRTAPTQLAEKPETTHYSVADQAGNAVSVTYTINGSFGAGVVAPGTGFLLNDEMDDFAVKPGTANAYGLVQGTKNAIAPGKRPLSSMAPTIILKGNRPWLVLGSPGGSRIITITLTTALNRIDHDMPLHAAVASPRIHYQGLPDEIFIEPGALSETVQTALKAQGYKLTQQAPWGAAESIEITPDGFIGANDPRRPAGAAVAY